MGYKKLTVIIVFLNEKYEVENTVQSIITHSDDSVAILLINDASDDGFDYRSVAEKYNVTYVENPTRLGVAASRNSGVELCETPYFLLLDAHMRFYNDLWVNRIVDELEKDTRTLLCCLTKSLGLENGFLIENSNRGFAYGACVDLNGDIEPCWILNVPFDTSGMVTVPIVCVLGAGYACSKAYWQYLKGLEGLLYYGSDEPYISIKVWLEGGSCKLLKDVVIGHIYRTGNIPYSTAFKFQLFNKLFLSELFLLNKCKKMIVSKYRFLNPSVLVESLYLLHDNRDRIVRLKSYHKKIFTRDFSFFEEMNIKYHKKEKMSDLLTGSVHDVLKDIVAMIEKKPVTDIGIIKGRMGIVIFMFHYGRFTNDGSYTEKAEEMLKGVLKEIKADTHYAFRTGLGGIGWGIEYLHQQGFVEGDINEILEDFDKKIMEINPHFITSLNRNYGLGGIVLYLLSRIYQNDINPFDPHYLKSVYDRICVVIHERDSTCDSIDVFLDFMYYYEDETDIEKPEICDICCMLNPRNIPLQDLNTGLNGVAGLGLRLILENEKC